MNLRSASRTLARTAWQAVPTVVGVILLNFVLMQWIPGDAADVVAAESGSATAESMAQLRSHVLVNTMMLSASPRMHVEPARVNADFASDHRDDPLVPLQSGRNDPLVLFVELD